MPLPARRARIGLFDSLQEICRNFKWGPGRLRFLAADRQTMPNPLSLVEKNRLTRCILAVAKVAQTDADEAKTLPRLEANTVSER